MKPIGIFQHFHTEGPGYFATYLERHGFPWQLIRIDAGEAVAVHADAFCGIAFMGGPMSVNDSLPWITPVLALIRDAVSRDVPVLGHCLGGQLMSKALGGLVSRNTVKEIGWGAVEVVRGPEAEHWFGPGLERFEAFHWHGETFSVPPGAVQLLASPWCHNQAFSIGPHLALQCHVEMTTDLVRSWCRSGAGEIASSPGPGVQSPEQIQDRLEERIVRLNAVAAGIYDRWAVGLAR